jgi:hypothetical protein
MTAYNAKLRAALLAEVENRRTIELQLVQQDAAVMPSGVVGEILGHLGWSKGGAKRVIMVSY